MTTSSEQSTLYQSEAIALTWMGLSEWIMGTFTLTQLSQLVAQVVADWWLGKLGSEEAMTILSTLSAASDSSTVSPASE